MNLNKPLFIEKRQEISHLSLDGKWDFTFSAEPVCDPLKLAYNHSATLPQTVAMCLFEAGELPHPYVGTNSKQYEFIKDKVWYFKRSFTCTEDCRRQFAYLCFDGCGYFTRVWVNGILLGEHEGMFGGPVCDINEILDFGSENTIIVEVTACNFDMYRFPDSVKRFNNGMNKSAIAPWHQINDSLTQNGHFNTVGMWRSVRIEFLDKYHITNPYIYTHSIDDYAAHLKLEVPVYTGLFDECGNYANMYTFRDDSPRNAYSGTKLPKNHDDVFTLETVITQLRSGEEVCRISNDFNIFELFSRGVVEQPNDYYFYTKDIEIKNPSLWYPNGYGEQNLYNVDVTLYVNGKKADTQSFKTGIRTVTVTEGATEKLCRRGDKFQFVVNGKEIFLKGMNFTQLDQLLKECDYEYDWVLTLAKEQGISLVRVWNGGGVPESDVFYELCDKYGLMVWQDAYIANSTTKEWDVAALRSQLVYNLCRTRNHPSFAVFCGGNEFNDYSVNNAASMFATWDEYETYIPDKIFYRTTPRGGSAHIYNDMEPTWYRHLYKHIPFIGESGIHNFPTYKTLKGVICEKEAQAPLSNIFSDDFKRSFPELLNHFSEFQPDRVPRMLARASHICDINGIDLKDLTFATQMSAYEYYLIMIECILENYPKTTGIMPWVFKRPWPTSAIQIVDSSGHPEYQYYGVKRAYQPYHPFVAFEHINFAPEESVKLPVKVFCDSAVTGDICVETKIFDSALKPIFVKEKRFASLPEFCSDVDCFEFKIPKNMVDTYFFVRVTLCVDGKLLGESFYYPKVLKALADEEIYKKERGGVCGNMLFENGPYLKDVMCNFPQAIVDVEVLNAAWDGSRIVSDILISNNSENAAFPIIIDAASDSVRALCSDNCFILEPHENKTVHITLDAGADSPDACITVHSLNSNKVCTELI